MFQVCLLYFSRRTLFGISEELNAVYLLEDERTVFVLTDVTQSVLGLALCRQRPRCLLFLYSDRTSITQLTSPRLLLSPTRNHLCQSVAIRHLLISSKNFHPPSGKLPKQER